jgi:putative copper resistance protein D
LHRVRRNDVPSPYAAILPPPLRLHQLLLGWQFGDRYAAAALAGQVLAAAWYLSAVLRLRGKGRSWAAGRTTAFGAGIVTLTIALVSGLASYDDTLFAIHVSQHLLLMMAAPPLLALGAPVTLAIQAASRPMKRRIMRLIHHRVVRYLTMPLTAGLLYYGSMYVEFLTPFYRYSLQHGLAHNASHVLMFAFGCLFWWPMVGADRLPHRPSYRVRMTWMLSGMSAEVFLGMVLVSRSQPIAAAQGIADTRSGGAIFLGTSLLITVAAALIMRWQRKTAALRTAARYEHAMSNARRGSSLSVPLRTSESITVHPRGEGQRGVEPLGRPRSQHLPLEYPVHADAAGADVVAVGRTLVSQKGGGSSRAPGMVANGSAGVAGPSSMPAQVPFSAGRVAQAGKGKSTARGTGMSGWAMNMVPGLASMARARWAGGR